MLAANRMVFENEGDDVRVNDDGAHAAGRLSGGRANHGEPPEVVARAHGLLLALWL
jgi:hypothetical protein